MDLKNSENTVIPLRFNVNTDEVDVVAERLFDAGASAVAELVDPQTGTTYLVADLVESARLELAQQGLEGKYLPTDDVDWVQTAAEFAEPHWCGPELVLVPSGFEVTSVPDRSVAGPSALDPNVTVVTLPPTPTFGSGSHPTTRLTAHMLTQIIKPGDEVVDVGSGSGVISVVAALLGADKVFACDIDEAARQATQELAQAHGVADVVVAHHGSIDVITAGATDIRFDVVVANILFVVLRELATQLEAAVKPDGTLLVSGLLSEQRMELDALFSNLVVINESEEDGWLAATLGRTANYH